MDDNLAPRLSSGSTDAYQLKITLRGSKPPIWRRVVVPAWLTLAQLHEVIQTAMGWTNTHLHLFEIDGESYSGPGPDGYRLDNGELDESEYRLSDVIDREKTKFLYEYDFGDGWEHFVVVEKIIPGIAGAQTMVCLAGKGRCPPEDCGGIHGYYHMLEVLANPKHKERKDLMEWAGDAIDPVEFSASDVTEALGNIRL